MAKKSARKRKVAVSRSGAERKFVKTGEATKVMTKLVTDLNKARRGDPGWSVIDHAKVEKALFHLALTLKKIKCPPGQSFPRP